MGKCQTLRNEAKLQLRRVDRELAMLQQERHALLAIHADIERDQQVSMANLAPRIPMDPNESPSPRSFTRMNLQPQPPQANPSADGLFPFADANLDSILSDSGAFARPLQPPLQPRPSCQTYPPPSAGGSDGARSILPPLDHTTRFFDY